MSKVLVSETNLTNIANSIRSKTGKTAKLKLNQMSAEIDSITGGGGGPDTSDATAAANDLAEGKTAYAKGQKITGNLSVYPFACMDSGSEDNPSDLTIDESTIVDGSTTYTSFRMMSKDSRRQNKFIINADGGNNIVISTKSNNVANAVGLTANKLKKNETVLGVTGTYEGASSDIMLFDTVAHMNEYTNIDDTSMATVYKQEFTPINSDTVFTSCSFPDEIVLSQAVTGTIDASFISLTEEYYEMYVEITPTSFSIDAYDSKGGGFIVRKTSSDGITYRRQVGIREKDFGTTMAWVSWSGSWDPVISNFIHIPINVFGGLYNTKLVDDTSKLMFLTPLDWYQTGYSQHLVSVDITKLCELILTIPTSYVPSNLGSLSFNNMLIIQSGNNTFDILAVTHSKNSSNKWIMTAMSVGRYNNYWYITPSAGALSNTAVIDTPSNNANIHTNYCAYVWHINTQTNSITFEQYPGNSFNTTVSWSNFSHKYYTQNLTVSQKFGSLHMSGNIFEPGTFPFEVQSGTCGSMSSKWDTKYSWNRIDI